MAREQTEWEGGGEWPDRHLNHEKWFLARPICLQFEWLAKSEGEISKNKWVLLQTHPERLASA